MNAVAAIATKETDAKLQELYQEIGFIARMNDETEASCQYDGLIRKWWLEGFNGAVVAVAQAHKGKS